MAASPAKTMRDSRGGSPLALEMVTVAAVKPMSERAVRRDSTRKCVYFCSRLLLFGFGTWH
jgi:hypothetical protein